MSELDRQVAMLEKMGIDDLRRECEKCFFDIEALKTDLAAMRKQNSVLKDQLFDMTEKKNEMAKLALGGVITVKEVIE